MAIKKKNRRLTGDCRTFWLEALSARWQARALLLGLSVHDGARTHGLKIVFANQAFCEMTGYRSAELFGKRLEAVSDDKRSEAARLSRWFASKELGKAYAAEGYLVGKDGVARYAAWSASALLEEKAKGYGVVTYRDMTEKRRLQEALIHAQRLDAVGHLAGGVAHDFNNLLSVINGYCEMLATRLTGDKKSLRQIGEIHAAGRRGAELTQQLFGFRATPADECARRELQRHCARKRGDLGPLDRGWRPSRRIPFTQPRQCAGGSCTVHAGPPKSRS